MNFNKRLSCIPGPPHNKCRACTGKTLTIAHKIVKETEQGDIDPSQVLVLTFTNKAAIEMRERWMPLSRYIKKGMIITTFHGFCLSVLRRMAAHWAFLLFFLSAPGQTQC
jgi:DNA helicase-2/ATP-dependent DNA helicase PcrA